MAESKIPEDLDERWRQIALIWMRIATVPLTQPDRAMTVLIDLIRDVLGADYVWLVLAEKTDDVALKGRLGSAEDWVPVFIESTYGYEIDRKFEEEFRKERLHKDKWTVDRLVDAGVHRTHIRSDILGDEPWNSCETGWLLDSYGIKDRMIAVHAIRADLELHIIADRVDGRDWDVNERDWLHDLNLGLTPFCARMSMSFGLLESEKHLSRRERDTLLHLLDGESEHVIADRMGLKPGTVHQYVVAIFRKFGVQSRSELMTRWMNSTGEESEAQLERELASTLNPGA